MGEIIGRVEELGKKYMRLSGERPSIALRKVSLHL